MNVGDKALVASSLWRPRVALLAPGSQRRVHTNYDREASVHRFVGPKRIVRIAGVYEARVAAGA